MRYIVILAFLIVAPCWGQTAQTGKAETSGFCSPAVSGSNNQFTITCQNIPDKLRAQLIDLLNRVAKSQTDAEVILGKLDTCMEGIKEVRENQAPWVLSDDQKKELKRLLAGTNAKVSISVIPQDRNASLLGMDLIPIFKDASWDTGAGLTSDFTLNPSLVGVVIAVDHTDFPAAYALIAALKSIHIQTYVLLDSKKERVKDSAQIWIGIGAKPTPSH